MMSSPSTSLKVKDGPVDEFKLSNLEAENCGTS